MIVSCIKTMYSRNRSLFTRRQAGSLFTRQQAGSSLANSLSRPFSSRSFSSKVGVFHKPDTSYGKGPWKTEIEKTPVEYKPLDWKEGGNYSSDDNKITLNEKHSPAAQESTLEHERAHAAHFSYLDKNDPENLLISELVAKRREAIKTGNQINLGQLPKDAESAKTPEDQAKIKEHNIFKENPSEYSKLVLRQYAKHYQKRFFDTHLSKLADKIHTDLSQSDNQD